VFCSAWRARCEALEASTAAQLPGASPNDQGRDTASGKTGRHGSEMEPGGSTWDNYAANPSGDMSHWELLQLSAQAPGVRTALSQLVTVDCSHLGLEAEGLDFLTRRLPRLQSSSSTSSSTSSSKGGGGSSGASAPLKLSLAHNAISDFTPDAKALGQLMLRCPFSALDLGYNSMGPLCLLALAPPLAKVQIIFACTVECRNWLV